MEMTEHSKYMDSINARYVRLLKPPQDQVLLNSIDGGIFSIRFNALYDLHSAISEKYNTILQKEITLPRYPTAEEIMNFKQISTNLTLTLRLLELIRCDLHDILDAFIEIKKRGTLWLTADLI